MSKISKAIKASGSIIRKPYLLNLINESDEEKKEYVKKKYGLSDGLPTVDFSEFVENCIEIDPYSYLDGTSLPTDFALLKGICKKNKVEDYLEIGTWRGESAANVAPLVKNCFSLNISDEEMRAGGAPEEYVNMHRFFSKDIPSITHIQANSQTFDFSSLNKKFDLIFIDGDHHADSIASDTKNAFSLLKNENSVIVWHDYGTGTETTRFNVLAGILDGCPEEKRKYLYHVSNTLCAIFTNNNLKSSMVSPNSEPQNYFSVTIKTHKIS
jgi:predicted O-methyltransferase YrrM